jgi:hypothetical protein
MLDMVFKRVLQAWRLDGALCTITTRNLDPNPVTGEKDLRWQFPAPPLHHPGSIQLDLRSLVHRTLILFTYLARPWLRAREKPSQSVAVIKRDVQCVSLSPTLLHALLSRQSQERRLQGTGGPSPDRDRNLTRG